MPASLWQYCQHNGLDISRYTCTTQDRLPAKRPRFPERLPECPTYAARGVPHACGTQSLPATVGTHPPSRCTCAAASAAWSVAEHGDDVCGTFQSSEGETLTTLGGLVIFGLLPTLARIVMMQGRARAGVVVGIQQSGIQTLLPFHLRLVRMRLHVMRLLYSLRPIRADSGIRGTNTSPGFFSTFGAHTLQGCDAFGLREKRAGFSFLSMLALFSSYNGYKRHVIRL